LLYWAGPSPATTQRLGADFDPVIAALLVGSVLKNDFHDR
jgi:hypothetical protein